MRGARMPISILSATKIGGSIDKCILNNMSHDICTLMNAMSANTVIHRHANIRKALQYAYKTGLINNNPADCVQRPRKEKFQASFYNEKELEQLFKVVKGDPVEFS